MGKIWMPGGGGGGASSDDCTLMRAAVPKGLTAVTADSDDEALEGTLDTETTLSDSQALSGQTYLKFNPQTKLFEKRTGDMANKGAWTGSVAMNSTVTIPAGYHNGSGKVTGPAITNRGNYGGTGNSRGNDTSGQRMWVKVPGGYYNENAQVFLNWADIRSMAGLTPDKIKKNVSIMGIAGTHDGFVPGPMDIYNRGSWGSGYGTGNIALYHTDRYLIASYPTSNGEYLQASLAFESSAIKCHYTSSYPYADHTSYRIGLFKITKAINFTPYNRLNFIVSKVFGHNVSTQYASDMRDVPLRAAILSTSNQELAAVEYYNGGKTGDTTPASGEVTGSIDISNLNISGYLSIQMFSRSKYKGWRENVPYDCYVHRIWFS